MTSKRSEYGQSLGELKWSDARALARIHLAAFPGFFLSELGENFLVEFYRAYSKDPTAITAVLRDEVGNPLGAVVGTSEPAGFYSRLLKRRLPWFAAAAIGASLRNPKRIPRLVRALAYRGGAPDSGGDWALLASICVDPTLQGGGFGKRLAISWAQKAAARGETVAFLTTDARENESVNAFYRSLNWQLDSSYRTPEGREMNRYTIELGGAGPKL